MSRTNPLAQRWNITNRRERLRSDARFLRLFVGDFAADHHDEMLAYVAPLVKAGKIKYREDIRQGLETIPTAFAEMLRGDNFGKMLVQVGEDPTA